MNAQRFLSLLPEGIEQPEVDIDPDGELSFEWWRSPRFTFGISINDAGRIAYSGLYEDGSGYGSVQLGDVIPDAVMAHLERFRT